MKKTTITRKMNWLSNWLLLTYVISMVLIAIIYIFNPTNYVYEVENNQQNSLNIGNNTYYNNLTSFQTITEQEYRELKKDVNRYTIISLICIFGIVLSNQEKIKRIKKLWEKIKNVNK